jgi:hypothetical protein
MDRMLIAVSVLLASCAARPSQVVENKPVIMLKSVQLPTHVAWISRCADHCWIDYYNDDGWHRVEVNTSVKDFDIQEDEAFEDVRWGREVALHNTFSGPWAERVAAELKAASEIYPYADNYRAWPGPNSNTFIDWLAKEVRLPIVLPSNAVGKDYASWLRAGITSSQTGLEIDTIVAGVQAGLTEGVELHLLAMTFGVGFWPPSIKLPLLPAIPGGWMPL